MNKSDLKYRYNVAVIGLGFIGRKYLKSIYHNPKMKLQVICDSNNTAANELLSTYGITRYEQDWRNVVKAEDVDIICICTPNILHYTIAVSAIRNNKHVICEKPLGMSQQESISFGELIKNTNVQVSCAYNVIYAPAITYTKRLIDSGMLGELILFKGSYCNGRLADMNFPFEWRMSKEYSLGGSLSDLAINILAISQYLIGDIKSVCGMSKIIYPKRIDHTGIQKEVENDDVAQFLYKYNNGAMGYISSSRVATGSMQNMQFEIQFTKGTIKYSLEQMNEIQLCRLGDEGFTKIISDNGLWFNIGYEELKDIYINQYVENLINGEKDITDFEFAVKIDSIVAAVIESISTMQWVNVDGIPNI